MHEHGTPVDVAIAFTEAWTSHDMTTAAGYVATDVVFEGPMNHNAGIDGFMDGLSRFAQTVTGLEMLTAVGTDERAMIMYDLITGPFGRLRAAEELVISERSSVTPWCSTPTWCAEPGKHPRLRGDGDCGRRVPARSDSGATAVSFVPSTGRSRRWGRRRTRTRPADAQAVG
jgi:SnoaL-like domain